MGRKPTPTAILKLRGSRHAKGREAEPAPEVKIPDCPEHLQGDAVAKAEWDRLTRELEAVGCMAELYRAPVAASAEAWSRYTNAVRQVEATGGEVVKSPSGFPIQNPWAAVRNKAITQMLQIASEFGMTAASKTRVSVVAQNNTREREGKGRFFSA